jgi:hypothetical protein
MSQRKIHNLQLAGYIGEATGRKVSLRKQTDWCQNICRRTLRDYQRYYNEHRTYSGQDGVTPVETTVSKVVDINKYRWEKHCRGLFELPVAA